jgi:hypothetical protein
MSDEERELAVKTLREICSSAAPATARASAARTLLELAGLIGRLQTEKPNEIKELHEMTRQELDAELARLSKSVQPKIRQIKPVQAKTSTKSKAKALSKRPRLRSREVKADAPVVASEPELPF